MMTPFQSDIGIVGAGPAGARAAELLAEQGAGVLMWDPKAPWEKPCGGGLPWSAFQNVPALHELLPETQRVDRARIEVSPDEGFTVPLDQPLYMVAREALARWQLNRAEAAGAELVPSSIRSIERVDRGWRLESADGDAWTVRLLVGADGAASLVRAALEKEFRVSRLVRRVLFERRVGHWLVRRALTADWAHALSAAVANATKEHDPGILRLLERTGRAYRRIRKDPEAARRGPRSPVPCTCSDASSGPAAASTRG